MDLLREQVNISACKKGDYQYNINIILLTKTLDRVANTAGAKIEICKATTRQHFQIAILATL